MRTKYLFGSLCVSLALFALPAAAQTPDGVTPANEGICNSADFANATPGLQGLCVAMCEAQDCEPEFNPYTGEVEFGPNCNPSSSALLANYNELKDRDPNDSDPDLPCLQPMPCPCWSEREVSEVGGLGDRCVNWPNWVRLEGTSTNKKIRMREYAEVSISSGNVLRCGSFEEGFKSSRSQSISTDAFAACQQSVIDQCGSRGLEY